MNRTTLSLIACTAALAAVTGFAAFDPPDAAGTGSTGSSARLPVERTTLVCPSPSNSDIADTTYSSFTPVTQGTPGDGTTELKPARKSLWGYGGVVRSPDGTIWTVASESTWSSRSFRTTARSS